jgi:hypothetical protein
VTGAPKRRGTTATLTVASLEKRRDRQAPGVGRLTLRPPWQRLAEHFGLRVTDLPELFAPRFNVAHKR